jgi:TRAP transporter TAXI family solute receptor
MVKTAPFRLGALVALLAGMLSTNATPAETPAETFVTLGTSESLYYDIGRVVCEVINRTRRQHGVRCSTEETPGSVYNLEHLDPLDLDLALVQSDAHYSAYEGEGRWSTRPLGALRSLMSLHPEVLTIMVRADSGISSLDDLRGRRINVGNPGSGTRATWNNLEAQLGWEPDDMRNVAEMPPDRGGEALCAGQIDANSLVVGHPSPIVSRDLARCDVILIPVAGETVERLVARHPYYARSVIAKGHYGQEQDVHTFGPRATLVTLAGTPEALIHRIVSALLDNLDALRAMHPVFADLTDQEMAHTALTAPLHPGAQQAWQERGISVETAR